MPGSGSSLPRAPRIAVVAVHGVADQKPGESARSIANLLASVDGADERDSRYRVLTEDTIRVPVRPLWERRDPIRKSNPISTWIQKLGALLAAPFVAASGDHRRPDFVIQARKSKEMKAVEPASLRFMDEQLHFYQSKGPSATYDTVRVSAVRDGDDPRSDTSARVDIYEMYWADLSRVRAGILRFAADLYQLFLHLSNLGAQLLDYEFVKRGPSGGWGTLTRNQGYAVGLLTLVIPVSNLFMLGTGLILLAMNIRTQNVPYFAAGGLGLMAAIAADALRSRRWPTSRARFLAVPLVVGLIVGRTTLWIAQKQPFGDFGAYHLLAIAAMLIVAGMITSVIALFQRHQPGARAVAAGGAATWFLILAVLIATKDIPNSELGLSRVALWLLEWFFFLNSLFWFGFLMVAIATCLRGAWMVRQAGPDDEATRNAIVTARITLTVPALGVLMTTVLIWIGAYHGFSRFLDTKMVHTPVLPMLGDKPLTLDLFAHRLLGASLTSGFVPAVTLLGFAGILALWSFLPIVWAEVRPPTPEADERAEESRSDRMGRRLTQAYRAARISGWLLMLALGAFLVGGLFDMIQAAADQNALGLRVLYGSSVFNAIESLLVDNLGFRRVIADAVVVKVGALISVSAVSLIALHGRLQWLALGLRPMLDIALDVDNYLRVHPRDDAPRGRIAERYSSLLKFLMDPAECGADYDAVVFIAHSQGTVITADLLRYTRHRSALAKKLKFVKDTATDLYHPPKPFYLFTMGSPLRQLYYPRFPVLYDWIGAPSATRRSQIPAGADPKPEDIGVRRWVNVYRSGDYVGRSLWFDEARCRCIYCRVDAGDEGGRRRRRTKHHYEGHPDLQVAEDPDETRREACIGPGAHTHYWDNTAPDVAAFLDDLIAEAVQGGRVVAPGQTPPRNWSPVVPPSPPSEKRGTSPKTTG